MEERAESRFGGCLANMLVGGLVGLLISAGFIGLHYRARPWDFGDEDFRTMAMLIVVVFTVFAGLLGGFCPL